MSRLIRKNDLRLSRWQLVFTGLLFACLIVASRGDATRVIGQDKKSQDPKSQDNTPEIDAALRGQGIKEGVKGLAAFFKSYSPEGSSEDVIQELIAKLGSDSFEVRTEATHALSQANLADLHLIKAAVRSEDLEISLRAKQVIRMFEKGAHLKRLQDILRIMQVHELKGYFEPVSTAMQTVEPENNLLRIQFEKTLFSTSTVRDVASLQDKILERKNHGRDIYLRILVDKQPKKHLDLLSQLATDQEEIEVRLAAAIALAKIPDKRCLRPLIQMLEHTSVKIRSRANLILRSVTGERFGFVALANEDKRNEAIAKWNTWLADSGDEAPLLKDLVVRKTFVQRLVVGSYSQRKVVEIDMEGNLFRTLPESGTPMGVFGNAAGEILVCDYTGRNVVVFDSENKVLFKKKLSGGPLAGELLENGNILVGTSSSKKVFEFDRDGKEIWKAELPGRINVVHRTNDNTTLVSMLGEGRVVELDDRGKIIYELKVHKPNGVRRLENGNTLVCLYDKGEVREYDPDKQIVWTASGLKKPARAQRLPDGNTIIYHRGGVCIYDLDQKLVRTIKIKEIKAGDIGSLHFF